MKNRIALLFIILLLLTSAEAFPYMEDTHEALNENVAQREIGGFSLDSYLVNTVGFEGGINTNLLGFGDNNKLEHQPVSFWLGYGGRKEDNPKGLGWYNPEVYYTLFCNAGRNNNHFHNPLEVLNTWLKRRI